MVSLVYENTLFSEKGVRQDLLELRLYIMGQGKLYVDHVYNPTQEDLAHGLYAVTCIHILQG